jgi:hypothetical protein
MASEASCRALPDAIATDIASAIAFERLSTLHRFPGAISRTKREPGVCFLGSLAVLHPLLSLSSRPHSNSIKEFRQIVGNQNLHNSSLKTKLFKQMEHHPSLFIMK